jgi:hypothetical protein
MTFRELIRRRRENQGLLRPLADRPSAIVAWFGAVQAQDYLGALWGVGQRTRGAVEGDIELAIAEREIVRTWPMRGTLHFVAADDVRWMLDLLAPRIIQRHALRLEREFELDRNILSRCRRILTQRLEGSGPLTRSQVYGALEVKGISAAGQRGIHIIGRLAQEGLICFGPRAGKQQTFVLLDEWLPEGRGLLRDEALAELAMRYFISHGPASVRDLSWWSGLSLTDARSGVQLVERRLLKEVINGQEFWFADTERRARRSVMTTAHLLPPFDEYLVGYQDRSSVLEARHADRLHALLSPVVEVDGKIVGTWGRKLTKGKARLHLTPFARWSPIMKKAIADAARRYGEFLRVPVALY